MPHSTTYRLADYLLQTHFGINIQDTYLAEICNDTNDLGEPVFQLINQLVEKHGLQRLDSFRNVKLTTNDEENATAAISLLH